MDNEIVIYTVGFMTARLSVVLLFGYAVYLVLRGGRAAARSATALPRSLVLADTVADDRC
jgi:hypothetical protein